MYCTHCGTFATDGTATCPQCAQALPASLTPPLAIPNHLILATLATLCCCLPLGIPAIIYAAQVSPKVAAGDLAGAQESSRLARLWAWVSIAAGGAGVLAYVGLMLIGFLADR